MLSASPDLLFFSSIMAIFISTTVKGWLMTSVCVVGDVSEGNGETPVCDGIPFNSRKWLINLENTIVSLCEVCSFVSFFKISRTV